MDDPLFMGGVDGPGDVAKDLAGLADREAAALVERAAVHEFQGEEGDVEVLPDLVDRDDVRMPQARGQLGLVGEALDRLGIVVPEQLEGDEAAELPLVGEVDDARAAPPELADEDVAVEEVGGVELRLGHLGGEVGGDLEPEAVGALVGLDAAPRGLGDQDRVALLAAVLLVGGRLDEVVFQGAAGAFVEGLVLELQGLLDLRLLGDAHVDQDLAQARDGHLPPLGRLGLEPEGLVDLLGGDDALLEEDLPEEEVLLADLGVVGALGEDPALLLEEVEEVLVLHEAAADHDDAQGALLARP